MSQSGFHSHPFDDGTRTKLRLFQLYTREWLPVFLSKPDPRWQELHLYDFFAGPGTDSVGALGSPLLLLEELRAARVQPGWSRMKSAAHFFDEDGNKIEALRVKAQKYSDDLPGLNLEIEPLHFAE